MGRLFDPFAGSSSPYAGLFATQQRAPTAKDLLPVVPPEEEEDRVGWLMEKGLGGLAYLGSVLDKSFGGRAVRGLLGGRPEEALSILPFSDTFGLTDQKNEVSGRQLLFDAGLVDQPRGTEFSGDDLLGLGAEILLDPSTYLSLGTTAGAKAALKGGGKLSKGFMNQLRAGERGLHFNLPFTGVSSEIIPGATVASGLDAARSAATLPTRTADAALNSLLGIRPFQGAADVAGNLLEPVRRVGGALFNPEYKNALSRAGQDLAESTTRPLEKQLERQTLGQASNVYLDIDKLIEGAHPQGFVGPMQPGIGEDLAPHALRAIYEQAEIGGKNFAGPLQPFEEAARTAKRDIAQKMFTPMQYNEIERIGGDVKNIMQQIGADELATGAARGEYRNALLDYMFAQRNQIPRQKNETMMQYVKRVGDRFKADNDAFYRREDIFENIPGGRMQFNDWVKDPTLSGKSRSLTPDQVAERIRTELTGVPNPNKANPAWEQSKRIADFLGTLSDDYAKKGVDYFSIDIPSLVLKRSAGRDRVKAAAATLYEGVKRHADDAAVFEAAGVKSKSVAELLQEMNLEGLDAAGASIAKNKIINDLSAANKLPPGLGMKNFENLHVPADMAADIQRMNQAIKTPEVLQPVVSAYDYVSNLFKGLVTRPFPAFHVRNMMTGLFNMWRGGALSPATLGEDLKSMKQAYNFLRGSAEDLIPGQLTRDQLFKELVANRLAFRPNTSVGADILGGAGEPVLTGIRNPKPSGKSLAGDVRASIADELKDLKQSPKSKLNPFSGVAGAGADQDQLLFLKSMSVAGQQIEDGIRISHYLSLRKKGWNPEAAADQVMKYQIDYRNLTDAEKAIGKRVMPWYAFSRRNLPPLLEDLIDQPGKITGAVRAVSGTRPSGEFVPSYIGEGASVPIPGAPDGQQRYISSFGLPFEDETIKGLGSLLKGDFSRAAEITLGQSMPFIKAPLEYTFDKQLYSGRPMTDLKPYEFADLGGLLDERQARILTQLIANTPASRAASTVNRLTDPRKDAIDQLIGIGTGVKLTDVDYQRAKDAAEKRLLAGLLVGQPGVRQATEVYVPNDVIPNLTPEQAVIYRMMMNADQRIREAAAEKKKAK